MASTLKRAQSSLDPLQRLELIELMVLAEMMLNPVPSQLEASVEHWAMELEVHDRSLVLARDVALQARQQAQSDFYRLFWMGEKDRRQKGFDQRLKAHGPQSWAFTVEPDPELAAQWRSLAEPQTTRLVQRCGSTINAMALRRLENSVVPMRLWHITTGSTCLATMTST